MLIETNTSQENVSELTVEDVQTIARDVVRKQKGMTLLEIMIVLAIIAAVMGLLVGPKVLAMFSDSKVKTTKLMIDQVADAYSHWSLSADSDCPSSLKDLEKYRNTKKTKDGWGQEIVMLCGETATEGIPNGFGVLSKGPDKKQGTEDDIKSWEE